MTQLSLSIVMLFDDALATEEIIYCRQKNIATIDKWVRNGK